MAKKNTILAAIVRERRKIMGLTQLELADLAGCGITFVNQLEQEKESIRFDKLLAVLAVLGLSLKIQNGKEVIMDGIS